MTSGIEAAAALPERLHRVPGVYNLRDTGGYPAAAGSTRWRRLLRSDGLHRLGEEGRARLRELRVAHVLDLRSSAERQLSPSRLEALPVEVHHVPIFDGADPAALAASATGLAAAYDRIVERHGRRLVEAIRVIAAAPEDEAVLVHCTAGKDRTGVVVAFALAAVGVPVDDVVADYAQTAENLAGEWADAMLAAVERRGQALTTGVVEIITASPAPVMAALLERVMAEHGSVAGYLRAHGMSDDELDRLTRSLVA